jgi:hypothetical protein
VGIREVDEKIWLVSFMKYDLGFFDQELGTVTSVENPCARNGPWQGWCRKEDSNKRTKHLY